MVRVMTGDALVGEHERLQVRMNQFFDRFESTLKQALRGRLRRRRRRPLRGAGALRRRLAARLRQIGIRQEARRGLLRPAALPARLTTRRVHHEKASPRGALLLAGCAGTGGTQSGGIVMEEAMVPSDPGISVYVRNKRPASMTSFSAEKTVLFVHGATYPSETAFDLQLDGTSWMDYIARAGYDVYLVDVRGYGRSTRPAGMDQPADRQSAVRHHRGSGARRRRRGRLHPQAPRHRQAQPARLVVGHGHDGAGTRRRTTPR